MDITKIQYPCYIHKKIKGTKLLYIHDTLYYKEVGEQAIIQESTFKGIYNLRNYVLEMIYDKEMEKVYIQDGMTYDEWRTKNCTLHYEDRLGLVRHCVNIVGNHKRVIDIPLDICNNPGDMLKFREQYKEQGCTDSIIRSMYEKYNFKKEL